MRVAADVSEIKTNMEEATHAIEKSVDQVKSAVDTIGELLGLREALDKIKEFAIECVDAYAATESAARRLDVALEANQETVPGLAEMYEALATQLSNTTAQSDTAIVSAEALFTTMGKVGPSSMQAALTAASDLAVFMNGDLRAATEAIISASEGSTRGLKQFGIELDTTRVKGDGLPYVLQQIENHLGGQAQAQLDTYAGKITHLKDEWEKLEGSIGHVIASSDDKIGVISGWSTIFDNVANSIEKMGPGDVLVQVLTGHLFDVVEAGGMVNVVAGQMAAGLKQIAPPETVDKLTAYEQHLRQVSDAVAEISPRMGAAIEQGHKFHETTTDIAAALGLSINTVDAYIQSTEKMNAALAEIKAAGTGFRDTVASMNQETVASIKNYLDAGVSAQVLATALHLTETQITAVGKALHADQAETETTNRRFTALFDDLTKGYAELDNLRAHSSGTTTDAQIADVQRWEKETEASLIKAGQKWEDFGQLLQQETDAKMHAVLVDESAITDALATNTQRGLQQIADKAQNTFAEALTHSDQFSDATIQHFRDLADQAQLAADAWGTSFASDGAKVTKAATDASQVIETKYGGALRNISAQANVTRADIEKTLEAADRAYEDAGLFVDRAATLLLKEKSLPHFAAGVQNFTGGLAVVGERGPELVNLPGGSSVIPNGAFGGGASSVVVNVQVVAAAGTNAAEQGRLAGDATVARLKALGVRLAA